MADKLEDLIQNEKLYNKATDFTTGVMLGGIACQNPATSIIGLIALAMSIQGRYKNAMKMVDCEEYQQFRAIYESIKADMLNTKDILELKHVEELFAYFDYLLRNKYLCYDGSMDYSHPRSFPRERSIFAPLILNEHGCCRHKATALADLFNTLKIDTAQFPGKLSIPKEDNIPHFCYDMDYITARSQEYASKEPDFSDMYHLITLANEGEHTFYLDPEFGQIFVPYAKDMYLSNRGIIFKHCSPINNKISNCILDYPEIKQYPSGLNDISSIIAELKRVEKLLQDNQDIIDSFYKEAQPKLEEAEQIYMRILKSI